METRSVDRSGDGRLKAVAPIAAEQATQHCPGQPKSPDCEVIPQQCVSSINRTALDFIELYKTCACPVAIFAFWWDLSEMVAGAVEVTSFGHARASAPDKSVIKTTATATSVAPKMRRATPAFCGIALDLSNMTHLLVSARQTIADLGVSSLTQIKRSTNNRWSRLHIPVCRKPDDQHVMHPQRVRLICVNERKPRT